MSKKNFQELLEQTKSVIAQFQRVEQRPWGIEGAMIELSKQVGDLSKRVMVAEKYYLKSREKISEYEVSKERIADEIFDIWFSLVRIAEYYKVDMGQTIDRITLSELKKFKEGKIK